MGDGDETASTGFGYRPESITSLVVFAEVHGYKYSSFYSFDELLGAFHIIFSHSAVDGEHYQIDGRSRFPEKFYFCQKVAFGFAYLLFGRLFAPMPIVEVTGMEDTFPLQMNQEGDAYVRRTESLNAQCIIFVLLTFINIDRIFTLCPMMLQDIF